ncbi:MAG TPA: hypothetical protein VLV83_15500 [Acidobacteriota bacterium]|nr:hypothetical protein [Acidobacteriota bacterium]
MKLNIELIFDPDCPNAELARRHLRQALASAGLAPVWREWNRGSQQVPAYARACGSPTILINGQDVAEAAPGETQQCRLYRDEDGLLIGAPSVNVICRALE